MKRLTFAFSMAAVFLVGGGRAGAEDAAKFEATSCAVCHLEMGDELAAPVAALRAGDVHAAVGLGCADCHGGDASLAPGAEPDVDRAKSKAARYAGKPSPRQVPEVCGRCHSDAAYMHDFNPNLPTDQVARYRTSVHGTRLAGGDERVATCISCHGAHGILRADDPRASVYPLKIPETCGRCHADAGLMNAYGTSANVLSEYRGSVHGRALFDKSDLSAPVCNDCHGNHGAAPPGVTAVAWVCGECHVTSRGFFNASPHKEAFDAAEMPECTECHGNHAIDNVHDGMVGTDASAWCSRCHSEGERGLEVAAQIRASLDSLSSQIESASTTVDHAGRAGMEVSSGRLRLQDAHTALIQARDLVHTLDPARVVETTGAGRKAAAEALDVGHLALSERNVRRRGLAVSLVFIAVACVGLVLLIRRLDARAGLR